MIEYLSIVSDYLRLFKISIEILPNRTFQLMFSHIYNSFCIKSAFYKSFMNEIFCYLNRELFVMAAHLQSVIIAR